ncbi:MAG: LysR family transcriptional regulator, partial [Myxococcota bacterium]
WTVAREGNLTRAAQRLHVTQSAVSVQLKKLESAIGHRLFSRKGRGLVLNEMGRFALDYADTIFSLGEELLSVLDDVEGQITRTLRVGVLATLSRNFQIGFLGPLLNRNDVNLVIRSGAIVDLVQRLETYELDIVLTNVLPVRDQPARWVYHTIDDQPVSLIGNPKHDWPDDLESLLSVAPLVVPTIDSGIRIGFDSLAARLGVTPNIVGEVDDMAMLRLVAREHRGVAVLPPIVVQDELKSGRLVELKRLPELSEHFHALTAQRRRPNRFVRELL